MWVILRNVFCLFVLLKEMFIKYSFYVCFIGGVRLDVEKVKCGNYGCKEEFGFLKNKYFKNDEGSESILD